MSFFDQTVPRVNKNFDFNLVYAECPKRTKMLQNKQNISLYEN